MKFSICFKKFKMLILFYGNFYQNLVGWLKSKAEGWHQSSGNIQSALAKGQLIRRLLKRKAVPAGRLRIF